MNRTISSSLIAAVIAPVLVLTVGLLAMPTPPRLAEQSSGSEALGDRVRPGLIEAGALDRATVSVMTPDSTDFAGFGADENTEFEIGSVTKTMTGLLLQVAIDRGEVTAETTLETLLPELSGSPAGATTLLSLSTHTSGLPGLLSDPDSTRALYWGMLTNGNPYRTSLPELLRLTRDVELVQPGEYVYSNLAISLLGHGLAARAGLSYEELLEQRIWAPLGMSHTRIARTAAELGDHPTTGFTATGAPSAPWPIDAYAPAGGVRSTAADMALYARALLAGTAPGSGAMDRHATTPIGEMGYTWLIVAGPSDSELTLHNGQTGGYATFLVLDRAQKRAVLTLSSTSVHNPDVVMDLIEGDLP